MSSVRIGSVFVLATMLFSGCAGTETLTEGRRAPLFKNLGDLHHPVSTASLQAQAYFDQGLILAYGFNHPEAVRSFRAAQEIDPTCAMAYWGEAYALGPNINAPMAPDAVAPAYAAVQMALSLKAHASEKDQAYIDALARRYAPEPVEDRSELDIAFMEAMREVAARYPSDLDAQTLYAESIMNTTPWDYYEADGQPKPVTDVLIQTLENVLSRSPDHPGAIHFYIHAVEASSTPERAEPYADRLRDSGPDSGHLVHMPSHIYVRVGRWHDAVTTNRRASISDETYLAQCRAQGFYPALYYSHNMHFLWFAAMMEGRAEESIGAARKMSMYVSDSGATCHAVDPGFWASAYPLGMVRFQRWDEIRALARPANDATFDLAVWRYAQGMALLGVDEPAQAAEHLNDLSAMVGTEAVRVLDVPTVPGAQLVRLLAMVLEGQAAWDNGDHGHAIATLQEAITVQDALPYMEPPFFYYSIRHTLGAMLLEEGDAAAAEEAYRTDLEQYPNNGWALFGLAQSLEAQGRSAQAAEARVEFERAWQHADTELASTRY